MVNWTSTGATASVTKTGLSLAYNQAYYFSVRARNAAGLWSAAGNSDGITVARPVLSIAAAKGYPDGSAVQVSGRIASAKLAAAFWMQDPDRSSGIRVNSSADVTLGVTATVTGKLTTAAGERALEQAVVTQP